MGLSNGSLPKQKGGDLRTNHLLFVLLFCVFRKIKNKFMER